MKRCSSAQRRTRAVALAVALFAVTACGVRSTADMSIDEVDTTTTTDEPTSTTADTIDSTPFENDDPSTTTTTTRARRPDIILSEALPGRGDVPTGFSEVAIPFGATVEPFGLSPECQAMLDLVNGSSIAREGRSMVAFSDAQTSISITASIETAMEDDTTAMHEFSAFVGKCHAFSHLGIDYTASSAELALGDEAFVVNLDFDLPITGTQVVPFGVTTVIVLRGDIRFAVSLAGGLRVNGNVIEPLPRDRQMPEELALVIDGKLSYLLSD